VCENDLTSPPTPLLKGEGRDNSEFEALPLLTGEVGGPKDSFGEGEVIAFNSFLRIPERFRVYRINSIATS
jgi:hypothetical protein